jgi:cobalt-zinc-cadmium efflux system outer membrane protein
VTKGLRFFVSCGVVFVLLASTFTYGHAQTAAALPEAVTLDDLLQLLRERSPRLGAERAQIEVAAADLIAAGVLPNPSVSYGSMNTVGGKKNTLFEGELQQQGTIAIPLLLAGQRPARREAAQRGVDAAQAHVQARYAELAHQAWQFFVQLLTGQEKVRTLEEARRSLEQIKNIVSGRAQAGTASQYDVLRMTVEAVALDTRLAEARTEITNSTGELDALLGLPGWHPRAVGKLGPLGVTLDIETLWSKAVQSNPSLEAARRDELAADAAIERARRERWPVPTVSWGPSFTTDPYGLASSVGISIAVPLFDRGQGPIARAVAEKHSATLLRQAVTAETRAELERAVTLLTQRQATLAAFERDVLSQLPTLRQMAEDAYRSGKSSILELLDASRSRTESQLNHLNLVEAVMQAEIDTVTAAGLIDSLRSHS